MRLYGFTSLPACLVSLGTYRLRCTPTFPTQLRCILLSVLNPVRTAGLRAPKLFYGLTIHLHQNGTFADPVRFILELEYAIYRHAGDGCSNFTPSHPFTHAFPIAFRFQCVFRGQNLFTPISGDLWLDVPGIQRQLRRRSAAKVYPPLSRR